MLSDKCVYGYYLILILLFISVNVTFTIRFSFCFIIIFHISFLSMLGNGNKIVAKRRYMSNVQHILYAYSCTVVTRYTCTLLCSSLTDFCKYRQPKYRRYRHRHQFVLLSTEIIELSRCFSAIYSFIMISFSRQMMRGTAENAQLFCCKTKLICYQVWLPTYLTIYKY